MEFTQILNPKTIMTHLNVTNKAEALDIMAEMFVEANVINNKAEFIKDVYVREEFGETGIGNYVAIPHGKSESVLTPGVAIAVLEHEIEWESLDGTGAKVIILFAVGADNEAAQEHLKILAMFSKRLGDPKVISRLIKAYDVEDVIRAFVEENDTSEQEIEEEAELDLDEIAIL